MGYDTKITKEQVKKIAELCRLELSPEELSKFSEIFTDTLEYMNTLDELDLENTPETFSVTGISNVFMRENENNATLKQEEALKNAKESSGGLFVTEGVFE